MVSKKKNPFIRVTQVSYQILGRGYFSVSLFAGNKSTEIEGRGSDLKLVKTYLRTLVRVD